MFDAKLKSFQRALNTLNENDGIYETDATSQYTVYIDSSLPLQKIKAIATKLTIEILIL